MFAYYIHNTMWHLVLKLWSFKLLWVFLFIVLCISVFLMVMYKCDKEELKKSILHNDWTSNRPLSTQKIESVSEKLHNLAANLSKREHTLKESQFQIKSAENALSRIENMSHDAVRSRYRSLLSDLKKDLQKTETEVEILQSEVLNLSKRRETLKNDLLNQQTDYQNMLDAFGKELDGSNHALSSTCGY